MIGSGCARKLVFSWGGNPGVGSLHRFRDAVENGWPAPLEIEEHSHAGMANRYAAAAAGLPFAVLRGYVGTGLVGLALGLAPGPFGLPGPCLGLLGPRFGLLGPRLGLLDVPPSLIGAPLGPRGAPLVEGEHGVEEVHVVVRGHPREVPGGLLREPLLAGQLPRHLRGAPGLGAEVADHGIEEVLDLPSAQLLGHRGAFGGCLVRRHQCLGELLGRPVYPLLLLIIHSALAPVLGVWVLAAVDTLRGARLHRQAAYLRLVRESVGGCRIGARSWRSLTPR